MSFYSFKTRLKFSPSILLSRQHDTPLPKTHLVQFYKVLHGGLTGQKMDSMNTLVKFTGPRFFSLMLPGYTAYILDFLYAGMIYVMKSNDLVIRDETC